MNVGKNLQLIQRRTSMLVVVGALLAVSACETIGPKAVRAGRTDYNDSLKVTNTEELLLNLVRLRFNDQPYVLGVSNISARTEFKAGLEGTAADSETLTNVSVGSSIKGALAYVEKPTIVYQPLSGKDFVRQLLTPVDLNTLLLLRNAGWDLDDILRVFADRINGLPNAPTAATSTPEHVPEYQKFLEVVEAFDELEDAGKIIIAARQSAEPNKSSKDAGNADVEDKYSKSSRSSSSSSRVLVDELIVYVLEDEVDQDIEKLSGLLELSPGKNVYRLKIGLIGGGGEEIVIETRSLMSAMFYLGRNIDIPRELLDAGVVNYITDDTGKYFNWDDMFNGLFNVRASKDPPGNAYASVKYGSYYYYIDASDIDSRETLTMLSMVFTLKAGGGATQTPILTIPVD